MAYKPKPELEEGNYIAYTDEPDTVVDAGSGGGGGEGGAGDFFSEYPATVVFAPGEGASISEASLPNFAEGLSVNGKYVTPRYVGEDGENPPHIVYEFTAKALDLIDAMGGQLKNDWYVDDTIDQSVGFIPAIHGVGAPLPVALYYAPPKEVVDSEGFMLVISVARRVS